MISKNEIDSIDKYIDKSKFAGKTILITGATGFIGRNLVRYFVESSKVIAVCRNKEKAIRIFAELQDNDNLCFYYGGLYTPIKIDEDIDYIFHTASPSTSESIHRFPFDVGGCNTVGTYNVLELAREKKVKGVLFTSSGAVYGDEKVEGGVISETDYFPIDSLDPNCCYSLSKKMGENLCISYYKQYHLPVNIVRISHTYGPGIDLEDGHIYSDFVKCILQNKNLTIKGDGQDKRPFCYITDAIVAFCLILTKGHPGEVYNMANNSQNVTMEQLAESLCHKAFLEKGLNYEVLGERKTLNGKECVISVDKLQALGWRPQVDIIEGFRRTVQSYQRYVERKSEE